jgi:signal transduction histidine kinase
MKGDCMEAGIRDVLDRVLVHKMIDTPGEYRGDLLQELLRTNIKRERILSYILITVTAALLGLDIVTSRIMAGGSNIFMDFSYIHLALIIVPMVFLISDYLMDRFSRQSIVLYYRALHILLCITVLILCSLIAIKNALLNQQPFAYIISMLCISSVVIMNPFERLCIYIVPFAVHVVGILASQNDIGLLIEDIFFFTVLTILALTVSDINYSSFVKGFVNQKNILRKSHELDNMYRVVEESLKKRTQELNETVEYEKLRTAFFTNISHELRTPLNVIFSAEQMLGLLLKDSNPHGNQKDIDQYMTMIKQNCYRLIRLIGNLIDMTKVDAGCLQADLKNHDIIKVVEDITLSVAKYIENMNINLTFDTDVEEKIIACDPDKIERIMLNLLSNAVKFTPAGGDIYVNIHEREGFAAICVKDTGIGVPPDMKDLIFEKFVQVDKSTSRNREGSGIGLSIVKSLVELHEGSISLESEQGMGAEFIIKIPDRMVDCDDKGDEYSMVQEDRSAEKINIEFSDIYRWV